RTRSRSWPGRRSTARRSRAARSASSGASRSGSSSSEASCSPANGWRQCPRRRRPRPTPRSCRAESRSNPALQLDDLDPVLVRIADDADPIAAVPHRVRRALRLDPLLGQAGERAVEVVHPDRDVPVPAAEVVRTAVVVEGELELLLLAGEAEEVVRRLEFPVPDDVQVTA